MSSSCQKYNDAAIFASLFSLLFSKESPGVADLLNQIDAAAENNKVKVAEIIKLFSRLNRTGLKIEDRPKRSTKCEKNVLHLRVPFLFQEIGFDT